MVGRTLSVVVAAVLALGAAGCASLPLIGEEDTSAEALGMLERAQAAMEGVESIAFTMKLAGDMDGQRLSLRLKGGAYVAGERAGEMAFTLHADAPSLGVPALTMQAVAKDGSIAIDSGEGWQVLPGETIEPKDLELLGSGFGQLDIAAYVTGLSVERSTTFLGEPVTKLGATLKMRDLLGAALAQAADELGSLGLADLPDEVLGSLGDMRVVIYVSETTGLIKAVHESFTIEQDGHALALTVDLVVDSVNEAIELPDAPL